MNTEIKKFTGPLDILLQLIRQNEMDIFDIDIHKITEQYLQFIKENNIPDLDSAGNFIKMAAVLIYIKSKRLFLLESKEDPESESEEDLEKQLIQNLLKMQSVQNISNELNKKYLLNRDTWSAGGKTRTNIYDMFPQYTQEIGIKSEDIITLMRVYKKLFQQTSQKSKSAETIKSIIDLKQPLPLLIDFIRSIYDVLVVGSLFKMSSLFHKKKHKLSYNLITFLSFLELSRLGIVSLAQEEIYSDIDIFVKKQFKDSDFKFIDEVQGINPGI